MERENTTLVAVLQNQIVHIEKNREKHIQNRLAVLNEVIPTLPVREPIKAGNTTMRQYMQSLRDNIVANPDQFIEAEKKRLSDAVLSIQIGVMKGGEKI